MSELLSAVQKALLNRPRCWDKNVIPTIVHPLGRRWDQPSTTGIQIDDTHALMDRGTFDALADYSCSFPSGVYEGKMWKRRKDYHDASKGWFLVWFGYSEAPECVSNNWREIIVI